MIILTILKVIGIILLSLIGIAILLLLLILFVPLKYKIAGDYDSRDKSYNIDANIRWFAGLLRVSANLSHENGLDYWAKIFGRKIFPKDDGDDGDDDDDHDIDHHIDLSESYEPNREYPESKPERNSEKNPENNPESHTQTQPAVHSADESNEIQADDEEVGDTEIVISERKIYEEKKESKIASLINKFKNIAEKIKSVFANIRYKTESLCGKINRIKGKISYYKDFLEDEDTKRAIAKLWAQLSYLFLKVRPRKFKLKIRYGADDPSDTGLIYGRYTAVETFIGDKIWMKADFEEKVTAADLFMKGGLQLYVLVLIACRLYFDKKFMAVVRKLKAGKN